MKNNITIEIKKLLLASLIAMLSVYYFFLSTEVIIKIVKEEYIFLAIALLLFVLFTYFKFKLKDVTLLEYIPNINKVDIKSTLGFFVLFQAIDFYYEDGFIGMISQWFMYWVFGIIAWLLTNNINFYKNYQTQKENQ